MRYDVDLPITESRIALDEKTVCEVRLLDDSRHETGMAVRHVESTEALELRPDSDA